MYTPHVTVIFVEANGYLNYIEDLVIFLKWYGKYTVVCIFHTRKLDLIAYDECNEVRKGTIIFVEPSACLTYILESFNISQMV